MAGASWLVAAFLLASALVRADASPEPRFSIKSGGKFGAMDRAGKIVIAPQYDDELVFADGLARVRVGGKSGFVDTGGAVAISPKLMIAQGSGDFAQEFPLAGAILRDFSGGLAVYELDGKQGYVDHAGAVVIPAQFDEAGDFDDGVALVRTATGYGQIDRAGKFLIEPRFERAFRFREGLAAVLVAGKGYGYIDHAARFVIEPQYNFAYDFASQRARVQIRGRGYGCIDPQGSLVIEPPETYKLNTDFVDGLAPVNVADKGWGLIDTAGKFVIEPQYFSIGKFSEGLAPVAVGDFAAHSWGYLDRGGKLVVEAAYAKSEPFADGRGLVRLEKGGMGFVDATGLLVIGPLAEYNQVDSFSDGLARVWFSQVSNASGTWAWMDPAGKIVWSEN